MSSEAGDIRKKKLRFECGSYSSLSDLAGQLADSIARQLGCDDVIVSLGRDERPSIGTYPRRSGRAGSEDPPIFSIERGAATFRGQPWSLPFIVKDLQRARLNNDLSLELAVRKVRSYGAFPLIDQGRLLGVVECYFTRSYHRWVPEELSAFEELSQSLSAIDAAGVPAPAPNAHVPSEESRHQYSRMARYGNLIIIITDAQFGITEVFGNSESVLGISASEMKQNSQVWERILDARDQSNLRRRILRLRLERGELSEEVRIVHQQTGEVRWLMLRALPQFSTSGGFLGWEGFGIDITDRRRAQEALASQSARVEALFEVARSLQGHTDPAVVLLRGLRALLAATGSQCGYGCFYHRELDELDLVAAHGLSERYLDRMDGVLRGPSLLRESIALKQGRLVHNIQAEPRAHTDVARIEDLRSTIIMPLVADGEVYGALVIFTREANSYSQNDFELVSAAGTQIALAVRQTELLDAERQQSRSLGALYRLSHELAKYRTPREIGDHAFPILQQEFALKRGWLGVINEQGTHVVGKAGFGAGLRRKIQEVQIELSLRHDFLDQAIKTKRAVVVPPGEKMECSGLQRVVSMLRLETLVIVPLVSLGNVIGVLVVEPSIPHVVTKGARMQLLTSMANELATVLMARRFEERMAEGFKMRMAGLLASGVAHNFNNLLQAILGQVSLLELQANGHVPTGEAARVIADAAKRGASLVSQLINFSSQGYGKREFVSVTKLISESQELYGSLLGKQIELQFQPCRDCPDVLIDRGQIQEVLTNLLVNAKEAILATGGRGSVGISMAKVRLLTGEIDPDLPPGEYVRIDVRDTGVGMDAEQQLRCFEPFFTTKNVDPSTGVGLTGAGLGLASAYSIIKNHNGLITVHSVVGEGATFSLYLPIQSTEKELRRGSDDARVSSSRGGVLLLGLENGARSLVTSMLGSIGYRSRSVFDLAQAREIMSREGNEWNVLLIDIDAVGERVLSSGQRLLATFPSLALLGVSSSLYEGGAEGDSERIRYLEKPLGVWDVESALQSFLRVQRES